MRTLWNPFSELEGLRREIDRVFSDFGAGGSFAGFAPFFPGRSARGYPLLNLYEDSDTIRIEALMPGVDPASLEVNLKGDTLTISGEKRPLEGVPSEAYHRSERSTGKFVRSLHLDSELDPEKVEAAYDNGILRVTVAKTEEARPRQIEVKVG